MEQKPTVKRKRRFGDRNDGRLLRSLQPMTKIAVYIMPTRNDALNYFRGEVDVENMEAFVREKRKQGLTKFTSMHVLIASYLRTVSQRPALNRFIMGQKIFARNVFQVELCIKRQMKLDGEETVVTMELPLDATVDEVYKITEETIEKACNETTNFDDTARILDYVPGLLKKFVFWLIRVFDYFGLLPMWLKNLSPFHASMFITSMASLGLQPIYHHLYNFGNVPVFLAFGVTERKLVPDVDGNPTTKRMMGYTVVLDERICDGYYCASAFRLFNGFIRNPEKLNTKPEKVIEDVE